MKKLVLAFLLMFSTSVSATNFSISWTLNSTSGNNYTSFEIYCTIFGTPYTEAPTHIVTDETARNFNFDLPDGISTCKMHGVGTDSEGLAICSGFTGEFGVVMANGVYVSGLPKEPLMLIAI